MVCSIIGRKQVHHFDQSTLVIILFNFGYFIDLYRYSVRVCVTTSSCAWLCVCMGLKVCMSLCKKTDLFFSARFTLYFTLFHLIYFVKVCSLFSSNYFNQIINIRIEVSLFSLSNCIVKPSKFNTQ